MTKGKRKPNRRWKRRNSRIRCRWLPPSPLFSSPDPILGLSPAPDLYTHTLSLSPYHRWLARIYRWRILSFYCAYSLSSVRTQTRRSNDMEGEGKLYEAGPAPRRALWLDGGRTRADVSALLRRRTSWEFLPAVPASADGVRTVVIDALE